MFSVRSLAVTYILFYLDLVMRVNAYEERINGKQCPFFLISIKKKRINLLAISCSFFLVMKKYEKEN